MSLFPSFPNLEFLRNQAKDLLKAYRANDSRAVSRVQSQRTRSVAAAASEVRESFLLSDALFVIAREHGFPSWPKLKAWIEAIPRDAATKSDANRTEVTPGSRKERMRNLAARVGELARQHDVQALAKAFGCMPLGDTLSVRALLSDSDELSAAVETLVTGLGDANPKVRYECAGALDHLGDDMCVEPLRRLLNDPVPRVRRMALHTLGCDVCKLTPLQTNEDFAAILIDRALSDPSPSVRRHAISGLSTYREDPRARSVLETFIETGTDSSVQRFARRALGRHRTPTPRDG